MAADPVLLFDCRLGADAVAAVEGVFSSGRLVSGPAVGEIEARLSAYLDGREVVAMGDMTHALSLALQLSGVGVGDEVLTLSFNCLSSNSAIASIGAVPIWVDVNPATARLCVDDAVRCLGSRTKAVVAYHVAGYHAALTELRSFCDARGLPLIEDANNAFGARSGGRKVGTIGVFAVLSFYANRQVNAIEGAALVCVRPADAQAARRLRRFGIDAPTFRDRMGEIDPRSDVPAIGMSSPLTQVNATLALLHLRTLEERLNRNRSNAVRLRDRLAGIPGLQPVRWDVDDAPAFWVWLALCDRRDELLEALKRRGIECTKLHHPNHAYSGFAASLRLLPGTQRLAQQAIALPCGWWLDDDDIETIAEAVIDILAADSTV